MRGLLSFPAGQRALAGRGVPATFASSFGQTFFISVFAGEIRATFDLSHGACGWSLGITLIGAAVGMHVTMMATF